MKLLDLLSEKQELHVVSFLLSQFSIYCLFSTPLLVSLVLFFRFDVFSFVCDFMLSNLSLQASGTWLGWWVAVVVPLSLFHGGSFVL